MPYFFILPAYVLLLLVLGIAAFVTRMNPDLRGSSSYIIGGMIGTLPGFIVANVLVTLAGILPAVIADQFSLPDGLKQVLSAICVACLFIGPFVASVIGVIAGFLGGALLVRRRRIRARPAAN